MENKRVIAIFIMFILISGCASPGTPRTKNSRQSPRVFTADPNTQTLVESEFKMPKPTDYQIGIDDLLEIVIWKHPDLSKEVIVRPDGKISYLLIGDVQVAGLTVSELNGVMTKRFEEYARELQQKEVIEAPPAKREYRIALGDGLDISVWKVPDLSLQHVIVRPDGKISYPLIGDIDAYGKTLTELRDELKQKLNQYVRDPQVSVMITTFGGEQRSRVTFVTEFISTFLEEKPVISILVKRFGSRKVIVLGDVNNPGIFDIVGNARLLDAIGYAGGFTNIAVKDNIFVIRGDIAENPELIKVNAWSIIRDGKLSNNIPIQDQDIVYVPRSLIGNIKTFVETINPEITFLQNSIALRAAVKAAFRTKTLP